MRVSGDAWGIHLIHGAAWRKVYSQSNLLSRDPGVVFTLSGNVMHVASVRVEDGIRGVYMCWNPEKLTRWSVAKFDECSVTEHHWQVVLGLARTRQ